MFAWLVDNLATLVISAVLLVAVASITIHLIRNKKRGKTACGCGCQGCSMNGACHPKK